jgi:protein TonB
MFAESLLESNAHGSSHRRQLATALSITMQALALAALIAVSTFRPVESLLATRNLPAPLLLPRVTPIVPVQVAQSASAGASSARPYYVVPSPRAITFNGAKPQSISDPLPVPAGQLALPSNGSESLTNALGRGRGSIAKGPDRPLVVSRLSPGQLISRTEPQYPIIAKQLGIQGEVVLTAIISKSGKIESLQPKSGHPWLARAALDAVRRWQYRPYILNGEAVEVETQVTVDFKLGR